jgi:DNA invertase Pin-like site-specific DNA recombinase
MELTFIKERQLAGIEAAKRKGIYKGRTKWSTKPKSANG